MNRIPTPSAAAKSRVRTITVFAPVPEQALGELTERLRALRQGPSPFAALPGTHFARLAVIGRTALRTQPRPAGMRLRDKLLDLVAHGGRAQRPDPPSLSYLVFSASYDAVPGTRDDLRYLEGLRCGLGRCADQIWGLCLDYPGWAEPAGFLTFFVRRALPQPGYVFTASDDEPSVRRVRRALRLREQVIDFAIQSDGLDDDQLAKQFREAFAGPARFDGNQAELPVDDAGPASAGPSRPLSSCPVHLPIEDDAPPVLKRSAGGVLRLGSDAQAARTLPNLDDVQNLVTSGYPRHRVSRHLVLRITDPPAARRWLGLIAAAIPTSARAAGFVDRLDLDPAGGGLAEDPDAGPVPAGAGARRKDGGEPGAGAGRSSSPDFAVHVALSYAGLVRLGLPEAELAGFAAEFRAGMASREAGLSPGRGVSTWRPPFAAPDVSAGPAGVVHLLVLLSAIDQKALDQRLSAQPELAPGLEHGFYQLAAFDGNRIPQDPAAARPSAPSAFSANQRESGVPASSPARPGFVEHFGFADGLSQPRIHGVTAGARTAELPAGEVLLGYQDVDGDTSGAGLPDDLARNGTYLVYRRLEQDVPAFRDLTRRLADRMGPGATPELAGAKLIGRWPDGTPLTTSPNGRDPALVERAFAYQETDADGRRCPVGAHIRRANPRDSRPVEDGIGRPTGGRDDLEQHLSLRHRMLRRGTPYGAALPETFDDNDDGERGMLFLALVGNLRRQFEFVQAQWLCDGNAFRLGSDRDVLSGAAVAGTKIVVQGNPPVFLQPPSPLVTCRGGEYFFLPGIAGLYRIASG